MIRNARKEDAKAIAPLILVILEDMELPFVAQYGVDQTLAVLEKGIQTEDYRYSYRRALVDEEDGVVAGVAFGYPDCDEPTIDKPLEAILQSMGLPQDEQLFTDPETFPEEWYLDTISVNADFRGRGIGSHLLAALPAFAKEQGQSVIGLSVDLGNPNAKRLYTRAGFEVVGQRMISGHQYDHMQKKV